MINYIWKGDKRKVKQLNIVEDVLIGSGLVVGISLVDIQTILGIIILAVQVCLILFKGGKRIYDAIKKKDTKEIENALEDTKDALEDLKSHSEDK